MVKERDGKGKRSRIKRLYTSRGSGRKGFHDNYVQKGERIGGKDLRKKGLEGSWMRSI